MESNKRYKTSAGLLMYKKDDDNNFSFFLAHPGGPFWKNKNDNAWSLPKGEFDPKTEDKLKCAIREFKEETGIEPIPPFIDLGSIKQKSGKVVYGWAFQGDYDGKFNCTSFVDIEWPPKSGKKITIPEVDKAGMFSLKETKKLINSAQYEFIERLINQVK
jgi:predicted NUDIX family NTP pyrophosphohydrolase